MLYRVKGLQGSMVTGLNGSMATWLNGCMAKGFLGYRVKGLNRQNTIHIYISIHHHH